MIVGLLCGFIDSSLGMGYGVTSTTLLISFGIVPAVASASVHTAETFVDTLSAFSHLRFGNVRKELLTPLLIPGVVGAILGAYGLVNLPSKTAKPLISVILLSMGCIILYRHLFKHPKNPATIEPSNRKYSKKGLALLGFVAAFIDISGGGGWGPICTPTFILTGSDPRKSVGTVEFTEPVISAAAVIAFGLTIGFENFLWNIVVPIVVGGVILTPIAAYVCRKVPKRLLGTLVGLWVMALSIRTLLLVAGIL